jgi:diguanylate cyclase (GGDEF)-like protein/PAS domain S-box-containing protein
MPAPQNECERLAAQNQELQARLASLTQAINQMHQGLCMYDPDGKLAVFNKPYVEAVGLEPGALRPGMSTPEVFEQVLAAGRYPGKTVENLEQEVRGKLLSRTSSDGLLVRDGKTYAMRYRMTPDGSWVGTYDDITRQIRDGERAAEALRESEERFRLAAEAAGLGIWDYDTSASRRDWSDRFKAIFGFSADTVPALERALEQVHPEDRRVFHDNLLQIRDDSSLARFEGAVRIHRADDGSLRWLQVNGWKTVKANSPAGRIIMTVRDVTDEKLAEERIKWTASHDSMTGLGNRAFFQNALEEALAQAGTTGTVGLLMLDIDHFKQINDSLGHDAGDRLLRMFATRLRAITRSTDAIARLGGDEFAVILRDVGSEEEVGELASSILERMREPFVHDGRILDCRASIGAALCPVHGRTPRELMKHADIALYASKAAGRATATMFCSAMKADALKRDSMIQLARSALREDRVLPYYQPKIDLKTGHVTGFEALMRWRSRLGQIRHPGSVSAAFTDLEVATALSDSIITQVIADLRRWLDEGVDFGHVAVNASAAEFKRGDFAEKVLEQLSKAGVPSRHFELEVTETVFLGRGAENVQRALQLLSMEGVTIALDDFGTGYASLRHLKQFPVDTLKIDCSFVRDMLQDAGDEAIIRAVINLSRGLGINVVAEGIERMPQAQHLLALGCDLGQGFLFSKAAPAARVPHLVRKASLFPEARQQGRGALRLVAS